MPRDESSRPERRTPAKGVYIFPDQPTIVWVCVCAKDRNSWITQKGVKETPHGIWLGTATAWFVGDYLLMPDHLHFFCAPGQRKVPIEQWVSFWKNRFSKRHCEPLRAWQRGVFHHRVRTQREYRKKWAYMMQDSVRKGFVSSPEEWPWKEMVHQIGW